MNVKKTLAGIASYALVGAVAAGIGGTLALQQDETATAANTYTVGDVSIKQIEMERIEQDDKKNTADNLKAYENNKPLYPACGEIAWAGDDEGSRISQQWKTGGSSALFDADLLGNVQDKMVFVENDGSNPAYVRTVFAFEAGNMTAAEMNNKLIHWNRNADQWEWTDFSEDMSTVIKGEKYYLRVATYIGNAGTNKDVHKDGILPAGETTRPSLLQLFLDEKADNELCKSFNGSYDILVASQAVQIEMNGLTKGDALDEAFGEISATNHPWMETAFVESAEELSAALAKGGEVVLTDDIELVDRLVIDEGVATTINLNGFDLVLPNGDSINNYGTFVKGDLTIEGEGNVTVQGNYGIGTPTSGTGNLTINGGTYTSTGIYMIGCFGGTVTINGGTFTGNYCVLNAFTGYNSKGIVNGGTFSITNTTNDSTAAEFLGNVVDNR